MIGSRFVDKNITDALERFQQSFYQVTNVFLIGAMKDISKNLIQFEVNLKERNWSKKDCQMGNRLKERIDSLTIDLSHMSSEKLVYHKQITMINIEKYIEIKRANQKLLEKLMDISKGKMVLNFYYKISQSQYSQTKIKKGNAYTNRNTFYQTLNASHQNLSQSQLDMLNMESIQMNSMPTQHNFQQQQHIPTMGSSLMSQSIQHQPVIVQRSLHYIVKKKEAERIDQENKKIMKSIMNTAPMLLSNKKLEADYQKRLKIKKFMQKSSHVQMPLEQLLRKKQQILEGLPPVEVRTTRQLEKQRQREEMYSCNFQKQGSFQRNHQYMRTAASTLNNTQNIINTSGDTSRNQQRMNQSYQQQKHAKILRQTQNLSAGQYSYRTNKLLLNKIQNAHSLNNSIQQDSIQNYRATVASERDQLRTIDSQSKMEKTMALIENDHQEQRQTIVVEKQSISSIKSEISKNKESHSKITKESPYAVSQKPQTISQNTNKSNHRKNLSVIQEQTSLQPKSQVESTSEEVYSSNFYNYTSEQNTQAINTFNNQSKVTHTEKLQKDSSQNSDIQDVFADLNGNKQSKSSIQEQEFQDEIQNMSNYQNQQQSVLKQPGEAHSIVIEADEDVEEMLNQSQVKQDSIQYTQQQKISSESIIKNDEANNEDYEDVYEDDMFDDV